MTHTWLQYDDDVSEMRRFTQKQLADMTQYRLHQRLEYFQSIVILGKEMYTGGVISDMRLARRNLSRLKAEVRRRRRREHFASWFEGVARMLAPQD